MKDQLASLETRVGEVAARLAGLRQENQRLKTKLARLERDLAAAGSQGEGSGSALPLEGARELRRRLAGLVRSLEVLLDG